jgi:hypothetical protein
MKDRYERMILMKGDARVVTIDDRDHWGDWELKRGQVPGGIIYDRVGCEIGR